MTKPILFIFLLVTILVSCAENPIKYPYNYLESKSEDQNEMILYSCGNNPNLDTLVMFCTEKKRDFQSGKFHYVVFFDQDHNAKFPNNPLSSEHNDDEHLKHIKALYTYNHLNGYSKLMTYEFNALESASSEIEIK